MGEDYGRVRVILHVGAGKLPENGTFQNWIGDALFYFPQAQVSEWTRFSVPFTYLNSSNPEYLLTVCVSGNGTEAIADSEAYFDDLQLIYNPEGIQEEILEGMNLYSRDNSICLDIKSPERFVHLDMEIFDLAGRKLFHQGFNPGTSNIFQTALNPGLYVCKITSDKGVFTRKIYFR